MAHRVVAISLTSTMTSSSVSLSCDPLNSPHPVPWNWVMTMLSEQAAQLKQAAQLEQAIQFRYYRSQSLISPDGDYAAYSRIQMQLSPEITQSRIASILFVEKRATGELQPVTPAAPFADNPFVADALLHQPGTIAMLIPIAWSEDGERLLAREFESKFGSGLASDFAVVWERRLNRSYTLAPTQIQYSNAVLLGWSQACPNHVLFRAGQMGEENWPLYAVDASGQTLPVVSDQPLAFGQYASGFWGPQGYSCA